MHVPEHNKYVFACRVTDHLGSGHIGNVKRGIWHRLSGDVEVAMKMLSMEADQDDKIRLLQEAAIMGQFRHPNIVQIHGVVVQDDPVGHVVSIYSRF